MILHRHMSILYILSSLYDIKFAKIIVRKTFVTHGICKVQYVRTYTPIKLWYWLMKGR